MCVCVCVLCVCVCVCVCSVLKNACIKVGVGVLNERDL